MKKWLKYLLVLIWIVILYFGVTYYPALNIVTGYASKNMASGLFLANRDQLSMSDEDNGFFPINLASYQIDENEKSVTASLFGLMNRKAVYKEGLGAILINDSYDSSKDFPKPNRYFTNSSLPFPYGELKQSDTVFPEVDYEKLDSAVKYAFDNGEDDLKQTRAVLVIYKDKILNETYTEGFDKNTLMHGWSMTKSITSTMYGVLQNQGKIDIHSLAGIRDWASDERSKITINNLLQMNSGLSWDEEYFNISDVTKMLYLESDMGSSQIRNELVGKPDSLWNYSSGTTNILSGPLLKRQFKSHQEYLDFWYKDLIDRIGMHSMVIETDLSGSFIGSSYAWATTRDWAKFGLLYLHEGNWNGDQVLDSSWVKYAATPTNTSNGRYGAQFWLNAGGHHPDVPLDMYSCNGFKGQYVFIVPSKQLVVVRLGLVSDPKFDVNTFLSGITGSIN
ncbi:serine hydrolase domain-containing protein [Lutimonas zeaxanthinifaciens]|uniref:serine hydrolase domain-containing protein n=1 Tax=Lutimonas zeaxanthinifaciens TaxID=3060215 RepID=UPI00265C9E45|nr:serine hydrolase [Lutimonas sp. YSD2104]WKK65812.1 serine hydrolase [Lutimonas sp. YSD2104]